MKHICCFICSLASGGAERQMVELVALLLDQGYNVTLTTFSDVADFYQYDKRATRVRIAPGKSKYVKLFSIFSYFLKTNVDCVISYGQRENLFALPAMIFRRSVNVICGEEGFTVEKPSLTERVLFKFLYRRANYIVPNSFSQNAYIVSKAKALGDKVKTIINYTDTDRYKSSSYASNPTPRIGILGRYDPIKNGVMLLDAIREVKARRGATFRVEWYGNSTFMGQVNTHYADLCDLVEKYGLSDVVSLNDNVRNVSELLCQFDAVCLPSISEGFSNSIAEAICCARPMLVSDVSDNPIMVHHNENGLLFNPYDKEDIANAFIKFLKMSHSERLHMSQKSREIAESLFDAESFVKSYVTLIEN